MIFNEQQMHIILDLDETCVNAIEYSSIISPNDKKFKKFILAYNNGPEYSVYVRPHLEEFLDWASQHCNLSVWSHGEKDYVLDIVKNIFRNKQPKLVLWRDHCKQSFSSTGCLKSIEWLSTKIPQFDELGVPILIDDLPETCFINGSNAINVPAFEVSNDDSENDNVLECIKNSLESIHNTAIEQAVGQAVGQAVNEVDNEVGQDVGQAIEQEVGQVIGHAIGPVVIEYPKVLESQDEENLDQDFDNNLDEDFDEDSDNNLDEDFDNNLDEDLDGDIYVVNFSPILLS